MKLLILTTQIKFFIIETITPKLLGFKTLRALLSFEFNDLEDLKQLLNLSNNQTKSSNLNSWENVLQFIHSLQ